MASSKIFLIVSLFSLVLISGCVSERMGANGGVEKCVSAQFIISYASYDEATGNINLRVHNSGTVPLTGFQAQIVYTERTMMPNTWRIDATSEPNSYSEYTYNLSSGSEDYVDYVEIRSIECGGAYDMIAGYNIGGIGPE